ncbi:MAG: DNA recombination protein RmuC [Candidatus Ryanbacteria bacterium CG10_big_fil_rev_8_21_14_0_10_43_42]|uniref:DNA recombination protein RmuC n=1 Tax=Candidatus Ryanbacteria bacterium CG10_big_fil_rev_8_21_14_0_10_43_42 TaxID=1974864 RepID=A0A2M8KW35_9BACT|nr:MAG: DNA recombination protein RmuC [Candidatus Ryanbacteria bacterium CG10_big_fil_rev_8_21_14_0_10_43_42]
MNTIFIIFLGVLVIGVIVVIWLLLRAKKQPEDSGALTILQNQMNEITRTLDKRLGESAVHMQSQFHESMRASKDLTEKLVRLEETNKQVVGFADQLKNLQDILRNPKQRGVLGEYYLETVLKNVLPPGSYQMQYPFADGSIVDAVVFAGEKIIPIDSKFSLENYERLRVAQDASEHDRLEKVFKQDLKMRIDETSKYIKPMENTMDFAMMFIPSEGIYYDLLVSKVGAVQVSAMDLVEYAFKKNVIVVSPTSFLAYLQTVLHGLRALKIEESAKEIRKNVEVLQKHLLTYDSYMQKLGTQMGTVVNTYNTGYKEFKKIDKDMLRITGEGNAIDPLLIEKPHGGDEEN